VRFTFTVLLLAACQKGEEPRAGAPERGVPTQIDAAYRADVQRICDVLSLSGADQVSPSERTALTAQWLGDNLETEAGVDFMIAFKSAPDPAAALRDEASRLGLPGCPLADSW
jgi:hypothetical protein